MTRTMDQFEEVMKDAVWFVEFHNKPVWIVPFENEYRLSVIKPQPHGLPSGTAALTVELINGEIEVGNDKVFSTN